MKVSIYNFICKNGYKYTKYISPKPYATIQSNPYTYVGVNSCFEFQSTKQVWERNKIPNHSPNCPKLIFSIPMNFGDEDTHNMKYIDSLWIDYSGKKKY